jgi:hypothetical protein
MNGPQPILARGRPPAVPVLAILVLLIAACSSSIAPSPSIVPSPSISPSPSPSIGAPSPSLAPSPSAVDSAEAAAALVIATDPRFAGLVASDPDLIGQCCFYTVTPIADGFAVTIEIGWGDCPAGCIERHHWFYEVTSGGTIRLDHEDGPPVPAGVPNPGTTGGVIGISGIATAGPTCPVVQPNDPACADRPVAGATIHVLDSTGLEVATLETDARGAFVVTLPPGRYRVIADAIAGYMGTPPPMDVTVETGLAIVQLPYDTGIR